MISASGDAVFAVGLVFAVFLVGRWRVSALNLRLVAQDFNLSCIRVWSLVLNEISLLKITRECVQRGGAKYPKNDGNQSTVPDDELKNFHENHPKFEFSKVFRNYVLKCFVLFLNVSEKFTWLKIGVIFVEDLKSRAMKHTISSTGTRRFADGGPSWSAGRPYNPPCRPLLSVFSRKKICKKYTFSLFFQFLKNLKKWKNTDFLHPFEVTHQLKFPWTLPVRIQRQERISK